MKTYASAVESYRGNRGEYYEIGLFSFKVRDLATGDPQWFHFSTRDDDETIKVIDAATGDEEFRDFFGGGHVVAYDSLVRSTGTDVRSLTITLSATSVPVQDMLLGYDCRDAVFEWRVGEGDEATGLMLAIPMLEFDGFVDTAEREDGPLQVYSTEPADSDFKVTVVDHISVLQRGNADVRSLETGQERSGDGVFRFAAETNTWDIPWGQEGRRHKRGGDGRHGRDDPKPDYDWGRN